MLVVDDVPSAGNAFGELELVVFVAVPSLCSLNGSSLLSLSVSTLLLLLFSVSLDLFATDDVDSLSFALVVVVDAIRCCLKITRKDEKTEKI